ncbi:hypothetical protein Pmi06nite_20970 [Planotetraspora mira]|uniref:Uncharacterized protein n=2 Tax=Planotetraspora mira TaxID=58121 RepID=A0A8J3X5M2_9ACTN|nr:hypothetical protein Pmi06nite_20970 [Planotetraspora mira]
MNEFKLIDTAMPDAPPSDPEQTAAVRARVLRGSRTRRRSGKPAAAALAALATVTVIVAIVGIPRLTGPFPASPADRRESSSGRYWRVIMEENRLWRTSGNYFLRQRLSHVQWRRTGLVDETAAWGPEANLVDEKRFLSSEPATAADRRAWKRAGSPESCEYLKCRAADLRVGQTKFDLLPGSWFWQNGFSGPPLTNLDPMKLPGDPSTLRSAILRFWPEGDHPEKAWDVPAKDMPTKDDWLWGTSTDILTQLPISSATRTAFYRMLTELPGARVIRRSGTVTIARALQDGYLEQHVVFDPATGKLSALEYVLLKRDPARRGGAGDFSSLPKGTVIDQLTFTQMGWTDEDPGLPQGCTLREQQTCGP